MVTLIVYGIFSLVSGGTILSIDASGPELRARPITKFLLMIALALLIVFFFLQFRDVYGSLE